MTPPEDDTILNTTPSEIKEFIRKLKNRKTPGKDKITNFMLKKMPRKGIAALANEINAVMGTEYYPEKMEVIGFNKPGKDRKLMQNYRPISLL